MMKSYKLEIAASTLKTLVFKCFLAMTCNSKNRGDTAEPDSTDFDLVDFIKRLIFDLKFPH